MDFPHPSDFFFKKSVQIPHNQTHSKWMETHNPNDQSDLLTCWPITEQLLVMTKERDCLPHGCKLKICLFQDI